MFDEYGQAELHREEFQQGVAKGEYKKALAIARSMVKKGSSADFISEVTGLSLAEIESLTQ